MKTEDRKKSKVKSHTLTGTGKSQVQVQGHTLTGTGKLQVGRLCVFAACGVLFAVWSAQTVFAGNIDSPAVPSDDAGRMYTAEQIYDVSSGDEAVKPAKQSGGFNEPAAGPASTMHTLDNIMDKLAAGVTTAGVGDILDSKTAITRGAGTGETLATGTMPDKEGDNASTAQAAAAGVNYLTAPTGFYDGGDRVSATDAQVAVLDADIVTGNIKDTVTIFGVLGTYTGGGGTAGLPKTGQTTNYRTGDDETYGDPAGGYDVGLTQSEGTWGNYWTDGHRFTVSTVSGDDIVTDNATGLIWAADGSAAGCNSGATATWTAAIDWAEALDFAGYTDWRLPNAYELFSICLLEAGAITGVKAAGAPYINQTVFPNTVSSNHWSSTTCPHGTGNALYVGFGNGSVSNRNKLFAYCVRAVRGG